MKTVVIKTDVIKEVIKDREKIVKGNKIVKK